MKKRTIKLSTNLNRILLCFKWIYVILYYTGCLCFQLRTRAFKLTNITILYTYLIRIALLTSYFVSMAIKFSDNEGSKAMTERLSPVLKCILAMQLVTSTITYIVASIVMEMNKYKHMLVIERFQQIDNGLKIDYPHINWNYEKTEFKFTTFTLLVLAYFSTISFIFLFKISNCNCDYVTTIVLALSYVVITIGPGCITFLHMGIMDLQRIRYRLLQKLLKQHYASIAEFEYKREFELQLVRLIDYCKNYVQMILQFNNLFGVVCGVNVFHDFVTLTFLTFLMCQLATDINPQIKKYVFIFLFMITPIYKLAIYGMYGYMVCKEQRNCIQEVRICENYYGQSKAIRNQLEAFLHWKMQNSHTFLIGRVTRCNLALMYTILNCIVGSVIILIQLQFQQNSITTRIKAHVAEPDVEHTYAYQKY